MQVPVPYEEGLLVFRDWCYTDGFREMVRGGSEQEHKYTVFHLIIIIIKTIRKSYHLLEGQSYARVYATPSILCVYECSHTLFLILAAAQPRESFLFPIFYRRKPSHGWLCVLAKVTQLSGAEAEFEDIMV